MKSVLRLVRLVWTMSLRAAQSNAPIMATWRPARAQEPADRRRLGPGMRQIGMGERFGFVAEQEHDIARLGLRFRSLRRRPARSTASGSWRPFSVWRGRR